MEQNGTQGKLTKYFKELNVCCVKFTLKNSMKNQKKALSKQDFDLDEVTFNPNYFTTFCFFFNTSSCRTHHSKAVYSSVDTLQ